MLTPELPALPKELTRTINLIVVHCSATPSGAPLARYGTANGVIDGWHKARGFVRSPEARRAFNWRLQSIGYHYVIDLDSFVWTGRHLNEIGAHVAGHNANSIGVCLVGGAEPVARYTQAQWAALRALVDQLLPICAPRANAPQVCGHRDLSPDADGDGQIAPAEWLKTCPGFDVAAWLARGVDPAHLIEVAR